jgi:hypothetical protein
LYPDDELSLNMTGTAIAESRGSIVQRSCCGHKFARPGFADREVIADALNPVTASQRLRCCFANAVHTIFQRLIPDLVVLCHGDDDFSLGVSFFKVPDRIYNLAQRVTSIDNRFYLAGFKQLLHNNQILFVWLCYPHITHFLAPGP